MTSLNFIDVLRRRELSSLRFHNVLKNHLEESLLRKHDYFDFPLGPSVLSTIAIAISPDGDTVSSTHGDHTVKVFKYPSGEPYRVFNGHPRTPWTVKYNPIQSHIIASGCLGCEVRVWNIPQNSCVNILRLDFSIISLAFQPHAPYLAVASGPNLHIWDWNSSSARERSRSRRIIQHSRNIRAVLFHPDGQVILAAAPDPPRQASATFTPCRLYAVRCSLVMGLREGEDPLQLITLPAVIPQVHLYSDGGLDISADGNYIFTCAMLYLPPARGGVFSAPHVYSDEDSLMAVSPIAQPTPQTASHSRQRETFASHTFHRRRQGRAEGLDGHEFLRSQNARPRPSPSPSLSSTPRLTIGPPANWRRQEVSSRGSISSLLSHPGRHRTSSEPPAVSRLAELMPSSLVAAADTRPAPPAAMDVFEDDIDVYRTDVTPYDATSDTLSTARTSGHTPVDITAMSSLLPTMTSDINPSYALSPEDGPSSDSNPLQLGSIPASEASSTVISIAADNIITTPLTPTEPPRPTNTTLRTTERTTEFSSGERPTNGVIRIPALNQQFVRVRRRDDLAVLHSGDDDTRAFPEMMKLSEDDAAGTEDEENTDKIARLGNDDSSFTDGFDDQYEQGLPIFVDPTMEANVPAGWEPAEHLCLFKLHIADANSSRRTFITLHRSKLLTSTLMKAVTSAKLSPSGRFGLIGFGVRANGVVEDHAYSHVASEVVSLADNDMSSVMVMPDEVDEVNIAQFHPHPGCGVVYGTKRGKVRMYVRSQVLT